MLPPPNPKILDEKLRSFKDAARSFGRTYQAVYDMVQNGRCDHNGKLVRLEWCQAEWGRATSEEAIARFRRRLNGLEA